VNIWFAANIGEGSNGGIARSMRQFAHGLQNRGHEVYIYFGTPGAAGRNYLVFAARLGLRLLLHAGSAPEWIIARSSDGFVCALVAKALRLKTRVALHNHGWEEIATEVERRLPRSLVSYPTTWKAALVRLPLLRATLSLCSCCISGTLTEARWLAVRYPRYQTKVRYVPNGVAVSQDAARLEKSEPTPLFLAIGGLTWKKNLEHTLAVFEQVRLEVPGARLILVGADNATDGNRFGASPWIEVVESEPPDRMPSWYETCPFLIASSRYEGGHSFAILEALSFGCVVFASMIPSTMEIIRDRVNGVLISGCDVRQDAQVIRRVMGQKELMQSIRKYARRTALRNRWERQTARLEKALCTKPCG